MVYKDVRHSFLHRKMPLCNSKITWLCSKVLIASILSEKNLCFRRLDMFSKSVIHGTFYNLKLIIKLQIFKNCEIKTFLTGPGSESRFFLLMLKYCKGAWRSSLYRKIPLCCCKIREVLCLDGWSQNFLLPSILEEILCLVIILSDTFSTDFTLG